MKIHLKNIILNSEGVLNTWKKEYLKILNLITEIN